MYNKIKKYAVLLGFAWISPFLLFQKLTAFFDQDATVQAYSDDLVSAQNDTFDLKNEPAVIGIKKSKKQIKREKQEERKRKKAALKEEKDKKRLEKKLKKERYKVKRRKSKEQQEQKIKMKQLAKEHHYKSHKVYTLHYEDNNLIKKQIQQKIELVQLKVDDLYQTVLRLTHSVTLSELLALLDMLLTLKKEYALLYAQVMTLIGSESVDEVKNTLQGLEFRIKTPLEKIKERLYVLFGSLIDPKLAEQFFINLNQESLSDQMQEVQELLQLQLTTIGKEGLQEQVYYKVQDHLAPLQQEYEALKRMFETQTSLLDGLKRKEFLEQMEAVLTQKEGQIQSVKDVYKDMISASKLH